MNEAEQIVLRDLVAEVHAKDARIKELREALEQTSEALALRLGTNAAEWPAVNAARAALAKED